jgi:AcrR family transcriptional regulator
MGRIRAAAELLLRRKTFEEITTREVAELAEVGTATLFRYIKSKQDLLMMVYGDELDAMLDRIEAADRSCLSQAPDHQPASFFIERVLRVYRARCDFYLANPHNAAVYLRAGFEPDAESSERHLEQGDRTIALVASILAAGQERSVLIDTVDAQLVAQNCHGTYMHEIERAPVRRLEPATIWERLEPRLVVQLGPLTAVG